MNIQEQFARQAAAILQQDDNCTGLAVGGSWLSKELDDYSDLDLVLITRQPVAGDRDRMLEYAARLGKFISGFTGEHVGEPRLLICLYDDPLLHVDIKFLTLPEFSERVEDPFILFDRDGQLQQLIADTKANYPQPDYQWIEDRFWTWIHYTALKIGRGELMEAYDFFGFLRMVVLGPLLAVKNKQQSRGVRKVEMLLPADDLVKLKQTIPSYDKVSILAALDNSVSLYRSLRKDLFPSTIKLLKEAEEKVMDYVAGIKRK